MIAAEMRRARRITAPLGEWIRCLCLFFSVADAFLTLSDQDVSERLPEMADAGLATTASGGAGIAAAMMPEVREALGIGSDARILCFLSEVPE